MSLTATFEQRVRTAFVQDDNVADLKDIVDKRYILNFTDGEDDQQAEAVYRARLSVGASATVTKDLQAVTNPKGDAINFAVVKALVIVNHGTANADTQVLESGEDLDLSASTFPGLADVLLTPSGYIANANPFDGVEITAYNKDLSIENTGTKTIYVDVYVIGYEA